MFAGQSDLKAASLHDSLQNSPTFKSAYQVAFKFIRDSFIDSPHLKDEKLKSKAVSSALGMSVIGGDLSQLFDIYTLVDSKVTQNIDISTVVASLLGNFSAVGSSVPVAGTFLTFTTNDYYRNYGNYKRSCY